MRNFKNDAPQKIAEIFKERLKELGISQYRFINDYAETVNRPTLTRVLRGYGSSSISTIAHYADLLGLEIKLVKKDESKD